jgi:hypothetical protein
VRQQRIQARGRHFGRPEPGRRDGHRQPQPVHQSNSETKLTGVPGKTFQAYVSSGTDWDSASQKFTRDCSFGLADSTFDFSSSDWTLTLTKQVGGNLDLTELDPVQAPGP